MAKSNSFINSRTSLRKDYNLPVALFSLLSPTAFMVFFCCWKYIFDPLRNSIFFSKSLPAAASDPAE